MRIPRLVWNRRHNVAALTVSYGRRVWHTREVGDLILGYNAAGRLSRIVLLDPRGLLPADASAADAIERVTEVLLRVGRCPPGRARRAAQRAGAHLGRSPPRGALTLHLPSRRRTPGAYRSARRGSARA